MLSCVIRAGPGASKFVTQSACKTPGRFLLARQPTVLPQVRNSANGSRESIASRLARRRTLRETVLSPAGSSSFAVGRGIVAGASVLGLGALCFYGLGLSSEAGAIDRSMIWPEYVKQRIHSTYAYFGGSLAITAASAAAAFRSQALMRFMATSPYITLFGSLAAMLATGAMVRSIPYQEGLGTKQAAWALHAAVIGVVVAPMCILGGALLTRAAWYTAGVVGGLSTIAACAPSEKFLNMGGPLAIGLGVVFMASLGSMFLPPTTALGAGLYSVMLYGGLVLFSGLLLHDTQRIIKAAESVPNYSMRPFDPVNASISIYMDTINIFIRIATILAGGGNRRK